MGHFFSFKMWFSFAVLFNMKVIFFREYLVRIVDTDDLVL